MIIKKATKKLDATLNNEADAYFNKRKKAAKNDLNKACSLYRQYVGGATTQEERLRRLRVFRAG